MAITNRYTGIIERYRDRLSVDENTQAVCLGEGDTPLILLENIPQLIGKNVEVYVKYEGLNPTGSFKDRGMTLAVTQAIKEGSQAIICASTGNTSASAAAYAVRAGIKAFVVIPEGKIAQGKLAQTLMYGAKIIQIKGNFDQGMALVKEIVSSAPVTLVNSINPFRIDGQKTAAFEIIDALGDAPDYHCLPVGNAGNITAYWKGYSEYSKLTNGIAPVVNRRPIMCGYQATGATPFTLGAMIDHPETVATAIRIGRPQSWKQAWAAQKESNGWFNCFSDEQILNTQKLLSAYEGIFCEPASAVALAGALHDISQGKIAEGSKVVCTLTGNGLKDPDIAILQSKVKPVTIAAELVAVKKEILDNI